MSGSAWLATQASCLEARFAAIRFLARGRSVRQDAQTLCLATSAISFEVVFAASYGIPDAQPRRLPAIRRWRSASALGLFKRSIIPPPPASSGTRSANPPFFFCRSGAVVSTSRRRGTSGHDMPTVHARTVRRAAEIVGAIEAFAAELNVPDELIREWAEREPSRPARAFPTMR